MLPSLQSFKKDESGIKRCIEGWHKYAPDFGIEFVSDGDYDVSVVHAGTSTEPSDIAALHGMYWSADYDASDAEYRTNARIVQSIRTAKEITVPSEWVAQTIRREVRVNPHIIPHGIEWQQWQHNFKSEDYILWNKNRVYDVCSPEALGILAERFPQTKFLTTFTPRELDNIKVTGLVPHAQMKKMVQQAGVYLSLVKETFGIGVLEAMASGVPVLGWNYGGNVDLVQHGVNGYLVEYGDYDDLSDGLDYCLRNREMLGANGREMAKAWTWPKAMEKLVKVFELANRPDESTVGVVIPVYNKPAQQIKRALDSVLGQSLKPDRVVIVDDGSTDVEAIRAVDEIATGYTGHTGHKPEVEVIRQENQGVANARNNGIAAIATDFVACLDSDDWLEPDWLQVTYNAMMEDKALGMAYTGMTTHRPDGAQAVGRWPGVADADKQMNGVNQVPTCCLFRYKVWERLGGYKQRYAPDGAGSEDAEFWLRQMAFGWRAQEITAAPLFNYSWLSGQVSGNRKYKEVDWTERHPFTKDKRYPFMAVTSAKRHSHPVHQYDRPDVSVVIPVGPGHEKYVIDALDSLEGQTFRNWEAVVVWDMAAPEVVNQITTAYPYVKQVPFSGKSKGAGYARNRGAEIATAPLLFWLDADDYLMPKCLAKHLMAWNDTQAIAYSDYIKIIHNTTLEEAHNSRKLSRIIEYDKDKKIAVAKFNAYEFDCDRAMRQPEEGQVPYYWCLTNTLVPKVWHDEISGYDETMESWEDADYAYRLVKRGHCYTHVRDELVVVRTHTGSRLNKGLQIHESLVKYMASKYADLEINEMGCSSCGGRGRMPTVTSTQTPSTKLMDATNTELVLVKYMQDPDGRFNTGAHPVIGNVINPLTGKKFDYGKRPCGIEMLVHRDETYTVNRHGEKTPSPRFVPINENITEVVKPAAIAATTALVEPKPLPTIEEARAKATALMEQRFTPPAAVEVSDNGTIDATDAALKLADKEGISLEGITGSGKDGRVTVGDVRKLIG